MKIYDLIVLGGGPAGYNAAERAGHAGLSTLLIEKRSLGGVCLNEGCVPTKTLLYSAKLADSASHAADYGVTLGEASIDHAKVVERKDGVIKMLVGGVGATLKRSGVTVVNGEGVISGKTAEGFKVVSGSEEYFGKKLLIATGSSPALPPIPGLKEALEKGFALTNREILELKSIPKKLIVVGGGVIGLEMAQYFAIAGSEVSVVEALDHIAGNNDSDIIALMQKSFEARGVKFYLNSKVTQVGDGSVTFESEGKVTVLKGNAALISIGRKPNSSGIGLEAIGVEAERGAVKTDDRMRTNIPNVYAAGDINGQSMLAHTGYREGEVAVNDILGIKDAMKYDSIPAVVYTNPEIGAVGETEATAKAKGYEVKCVKLPMQFSGRYVAENQGGNGICKLVFDAKRKVLLGAHVYANYSSEFVVSAGMMIDLKLNVDQMKKFVFPHPTVCEIFREALFAF